MKNQNNTFTENKTFFRKLFLLFFLLFLTASVFFLNGKTFSGFAQTKDKNEKTIQRASFSFPDEPVEIVSAGNSQKTIKLNEKFVQKIDWLKDFTVRVKNKYNKNITYIRLNLDFPETISTGNVMTFPLTYGISSMFPSKDNKAATVESGETVEFTLPENQYRQLKSFIESRHLLDDLSKVEIRVVIILFEDGTGWSTGVLVRPDPNNPKKFISIDSSN